MARAIVTVILLALIGTAAAAEGDDSAIKELAAIGRLIAETEEWFFVNNDPVRRAILCRLGYQNFTIAELARDTAINPDRIKHAAQELIAHELAQVVDEKTLAPANAKAAKKMRSWADRWCGADESCGVR